MEIQQQQNKPYVRLDEDNCILTIKGASYPEHAGNFYEPIMEYINECLPKIKENKVMINLAMTLMNSVSEKCIYKIITTLCENANVCVNWYHEYDDEDMEDEGKMWKSTIKAKKFNIYSIKDFDNLQL